jgi:hypothetical protein
MNRRWPLERSIYTTALQLTEKESDSITAHLNEYEGIISQLSAQGADEYPSTVMGNLHQDRMQRNNCGYELLRDYELHSV